MRQVSAAMTGVSPECIGMTATVTLGGVTWTGTVVGCDPMEPSEGDRFAASIGEPRPPRHWVTVIEP